MGFSTKGDSLHQEKGYALLLALVVSMIVVSLGFTLSIIALKGISISNLTIESSKAFYAQEAGTECVRYWAIRDATNQSVEYFTGNGTFTFTCNGEIYGYNGNEATCTIGECSHDYDEDSGNHTFNFEFGYEEYGEDRYWSEIEVVRKPAPENFRDIDINSAGYNLLDHPRSVQRFRETNISGLCSFADYGLVLDRSGSINDRSLCANPPCEPTEFDIMVEAVQLFADKLFVDGDEYSKIAITSFAGGITPATTTHTSLNLGGDSDEINDGIEDFEDGGTGGLTRMKYGIENVMSEYDNYGRDPDDYPPYIVLTTDGAPNYPSEEANSYNGGDDACDRNKDGDLIDPSYCYLRITEESVEEAKDQGIGFFVIGIGAESVGGCSGYREENYEGHTIEDDGNCGEWLGNVIAGSANDQSTTTVANAFWYPVDGFGDELFDAFESIAQCVRPTDDK